MIDKTIKVRQKIKENIEHRISLFRIFDEPRPKYIAKITIIDKFLDKIFLWIIPDYVKPNHVTIFRFISIPFIIYFLTVENYKIAFILFIISAFSDAVDGSLARTRSQITDWGIIFDPFADKLLIGSVGGILIFNFLNPFIALIIVLLEITLITSVYYRFKGEVVPAKSAGKIKMVLQCLGVSLILLFLIIGHPFILILATYIFYLAIIFALISIFVYRSI